jgi:predicted DNA-binding transcriptional regulator AlpA
MELIVLKKSELEDVIRQTVKSLLSENEVKKKNLNVNEAVEYLNEIGIPITKSTLYRHTMDATIPFKRFGERKLIFNADELEEWANSKLK